MTEKASISTRRPPLPGIPLALLLLAASCVFLASCSNNSTPATPAAATPGALATITITASVTSLTDTDMSETMTATAADSNGVAITGLTFTWTSSNPNIATINGSTSGIVPAAPGFTVITASAGGISSGGVTLTVTAPLSGQYAFLVQGFDDASGDQVAIIGSFVTDGMGNITGGVEDINGPPGGVGAFPGIALPAELTFTGKYTPGTGSQNPGIMSFVNSAGFTNQFTFSTGTLSAGVPTVGRMTEWDDSSGSNSQRASGSFYLQNTSAFALSSISGPYAFQFFGQQTAPGSWYVTTGAFTADGNGNLNPGELDMNVPSSGPSQHIPSFTAALATNPGNPTDTTTFGQLLVTFTSGVSQTGYLYIVSPTQALFMEGDTESSSGLEAGQILAQSTPPFSNASLNGVSVEYEQGLGSTVGQPLAAIGLITFTNGTAAAVSRDSDDSGTLSTQSGSLSSSGPDASGRAVFSGTPASVIVYLVSTNQGFLMSTTASATMGFFQPQSGPFSAGSINGNYFGGTVPPTVQSTLNYMQSGVTRSIGIPVVNDAELIGYGNGSAIIALDVSFNGGPINSLHQAGPFIPLSLTVSANGRAVDTVTRCRHLLPHRTHELLGAESWRRRPLARSAHTRHRPLSAIASRDGRMCFSSSPLRSGAPDMEPEVMARSYGGSRYFRHPRQFSAFPNRLDTKPLPSYNQMF